MAKKSKRFRIGVEGATTDGRTIERSWLEEMAASYDPAVYTALINMEHIKGFTPDSMFRRFGTVDRLETEVLTAPEALAGKMALYAWMTPTDDLVNYTASLQKLFTSMEVNTKFSDTGKAYLVGLAVTDDPASLGTEMLQFSANASANPLARRKQDKDNLFTAAEETVIEFEDVSEKTSLFSRVKELLSRKQVSDDARFSDVHSAVEAVAEEHHTLSGRVDDHENQMATYAARLKALEEQFTATQEELSGLQEKLSREDGRQDRRPLSTGGSQTSGELTNC
jgi:hypothetical protein